MMRPDEFKAISLFGQIAKMGNEIDSANLDILDDFQDLANEDETLDAYDPDMFAIVLASRLNGADIEEWDNSDDASALYKRKRNELLEELGI